MIRKSAKGLEAVADIPFLFRTEACEFVSSAKLCDDLFIVSGFDPVHEFRDGYAILDVSLFNLFQLYRIFHCFHKNRRICTFYGLTRNILIKRIIHFHRIDHGNIIFGKIFDIFINIIVRMQNNIDFCKFRKDLVVQLGFIHIKIYAVCLYNRVGEQEREEIDVIAAHIEQPADVIQRSNDMYGCTLFFHDLPYSF